MQDSCAAFNEAHAPWVAWPHVARLHPTQARTLTPAMFKDVRQLVSCSAVKVAPKEGDTVDRAKYYQGACV